MFSKYAPLWTNVETYPALPTQNINTFTILDLGYLVGSYASVGGGADLPPLNTMLEHDLCIFEILHINIFKI